MQPTAQASLRFWGETKRVKEQLNTPRKHEQRFITEPLVFEVPSSDISRMQKTNAGNTVKAFVTFSVSHLPHQNAFFCLICLPSKTKPKQQQLYPHGLKGTGWLLKIQALIRCRRLEISGGHADLRGGLGLLARLTSQDNTWSPWQRICSSSSQYKSAYSRQLVAACEQPPFLF